MKINEAIRSREVIDEIISVERKYGGQALLVRPGRKLVRQGILQKQNAKGSFRKYLFVLFNDALLYGTEGTGSKGKIRGLLPLLTLRFGAKEGEGRIITVRSPSKAFHVQASKEKEAQEWLDELRRWQMEMWKKQVQAKQEAKVRAKEGKKETASSRIRKDSRAMKSSYDRNSLKETKQNKKQEGTKEEEDTTLLEPLPSLTLAPLFKYDNVCGVCKKGFGLTTSRVHCRVCGCSVHEKCATNKAMVPRLDPVQPVRHCPACHLQQLSGK